MLGALLATPMAEARAETPPQIEIARSRGVTMAPHSNHDRDCALNTNVMQDAGLITLVNTLAERLKWARENVVRLSQEELARRAGVSQGTIGNIESGSRRNPRELLAIARAAGVRAEWLKYGKEPRLATEMEFTPGAARIEVTGHAPTVSVRPAVSIDDAARTIAEALMKLDGQQRRSAEGALQILVSTPDQWPAVAALLRNLAEPTPKGGEGLGESPASPGRDQAAGGRS